MQIVPSQTTKSLAACFLFLSQIVKGHLCCVRVCFLHHDQGLLSLSSSDILMQIALKLYRCSLRCKKYNKINNHQLEFGDTLNQYDIDAAIWN